MSASLIFHLLFSFNYKSPGIFQKQVQKENFQGPRKRFQIQEFLKISEVKRSSCLRYTIRKVPRIAILETPTSVINYSISTNLCLKYTSAGSFRFVCQNCVVLGIALTTRRPKEIKYILHILFSQSATSSWTCRRNCKRNLYLVTLSLDWKKRKCWKANCCRHL